MSKQADYEKEPWWNCLTQKEREAVIKELEAEGLPETLNEDSQPKKAGWKACELFGWG